ncbi:hypothetical protein LCGC14_2585030, partial [marine sediment metagenome]
MGARPKPPYCSSKSPVSSRTLPAARSRVSAPAGPSNRPAEARRIAWATFSARWSTGGQPQRVGPPAAAGHQLRGGHVDRVHVRALFTVHLDGDEVLIQDAGNGFVLERLPLHNVAPVAGGIAHGQEDRLAFFLGGGERLGPPGVPVHRVVGVLQQVGALLPAQPVTFGGRRMHWHGLVLLLGAALPVCRAALGRTARKPRQDRHGQGRNNGKSACHDTSLFARTDHRLHVRPTRTARPAHSLQYRRPTQGPAARGRCGDLPCLAIRGPHNTQHEDILLRQRA